MTVQLAHAFLDLLWLTATWNLGQTSSSDLRTKNEASSKSIPWWQCMTVAWDGTARGTSRNELSKKTNKFILPWAGRSTRMFIWTCTIALCINA